MADNPNLCMLILWIATSFLFQTLLQGVQFQVGSDIISYFTGHLSKLAPKSCRALHSKITMAGKVVPYYLK